VSELPAGWRSTTVGDVADTALGKMLDKGRPKGHVHVPYLRNVNVQWGRIDTHDLLTMELAEDERKRFGVSTGDLLVCEGGEVGRAAIWERDGEYVAYQKALHRVRPRGGVDARFLMYAFEHAARSGALAPLTTGSTISHLPQQKLRRVPINIPAHIEQRRIVEILEDHLSRLDAGTHGLDVTTRRLRALVKSVLSALIPDAAAYPEGWESTTIGEAGCVELGRQRHPDWHTGLNMHPYLRVANVFEDRIDAKDLKEMHWPDKTFERFRLHPGDVLLNEGQSPEWLGRPAIYRGVPEKVAFTNSLLRFKARADVLPEFALLVFRRHMHAGRFARESRITTNIAHLSATRLKAVEFPVPPFGEQQRIVALAAEQLAAVQRLEGEIDVARRKSRSLRKSLLSAAFSGRLTGASSDMDRVEELAEAMA
jgi:type I restriction enzyme S subunit